MLTKPRFSILDFLLWTRWETCVFLVYAIALALTYHLAHWTFLQLP